MTTEIARIFKSFDDGRQADMLKGIARQSPQQYIDEYKMIQKYASFINSGAHIKQKVVYEDEYLSRPYIGTTPDEDKRILESANDVMDYINRYSAKAITQEELEYKSLQGSFEERRKDSEKEEIDYNEIDIF